MIRLSPIHIHAVGLCSMCAIAGGVYVLGIQSRVSSDRQDRIMLGRVGELDREFEELDRRARGAELKNIAIERASERGLGLRSPRDRNAVLAQITQIASDSGLETDEIVPGNGVVSELDDSFMSTPIRFLARGGVGEVLDMFSSVQALMPGVEVMGFEISADPFADRPGSVSIDFSWHADRSE